MTSKTITPVNNKKWPVFKNRRSFFRKYLRRLIRAWKNLRNMLPKGSEDLKVQQAKEYINHKIKEIREIIEEEPKTLKTLLAEQTKCQETHYLSFLKEIQDAKTRKKEILNQSN